jgi:hypothetical protein
MTSTKKIPPFVQIGAWVLALFVFAVGFWHTHLGLKEMKPFGTEWGGLVIASIVLLLLLITYWFAVNGRKMALIFYILCGVIFFVCNLNYFYPAYMARTLIKEEAVALKDTIDTYSKVNTFSNETYAKNDKLSEFRDEIKTQIENDGGFGTVAASYLQKFNETAGTQIDPPNNLTLNEEQKENLLKRLDEEINKWQIRNAGDGLADAAALIEGKMELETLREQTAPLLEKIGSEDEEFKLDSIRNHPKVILIKETVQRINSAVIKMNKGNKKQILPELAKEKYPRADKLGEIQNTFITIGERINQISTWAIIILCLFIDLVVPLAIYLLLRKKGDEPDDKSLQGKIKPTSF